MNAVEPAVLDAEPAPTRAAELERLLDATRALYAALAGGDWALAAGLEAERRVRIERIFDGAPEPAELPQFTATLREIVRLNDELIGVAEHRRRAVEREADTAARGRAAVRAYGAAESRDAADAADGHDARSSAAVLRLAPLAADGN